MDVVAAQQLTGMLTGMRTSAVTTLLAGTLAIALCGDAHVLLPAPLERFLARPQDRPRQHTAVRRLEAHNPKFNKRAWLDAEAVQTDSGTLTYRPIAQGGSELLLRRVLFAALEAERTVLSAPRASSALTPANYLFDTLSAEQVRIRPRRRDPLLVDGRLTFLEDGDLAAIEGRLSRTPSFWITEVRIVREYARVCGFHLPVRMSSRADVRLAGESTFSMRYEYLTIDGRPLRDPGAPDRGCS